MSDFIPVNVPLLEGNEKNYLAECIDTGWISSEGPLLSDLKKNLHLEWDVSTELP